MSEEQLSVEQQATNMGWVPQGDFRGDPEKWVDAETFVERGQQIMPILRANNRDLQQTVTSLQRQLQETRQVVDSYAESMEAMKDLQKKAVKEAAERTRREVLAAMKVAKENGDVDAELELNEQLVEVRQQIREIDAAPTEATPKGQQAPVKPDADTLAWMGNNPWFEKDPALTGLAMGLANAIKADPATSSLTGRAFFDKLDERLAEYLPSRRSAPARVEGSRGSGSAGDEGSGGKGYNALPADAKAECEKESRRFVGEGKAFKDISAWRKHFAALYFGEE